MPSFKKFPKGVIRKNDHFYSWAFVFSAIGIWGLFIIFTGELVGRDGEVALKGKAAVAIGMGLIGYAVYTLVHMFTKVEEEEIKHEEFHELENFEEQIFGYNTKFEIQNTYTVSGKSLIPVFYYFLEITLNKPLKFHINIKQRDKIEYFLWRLGITRFFDVLTKNFYFDSKYRVQCSDKQAFRSIFGIDVIYLLEKFDRDYPPIRKKNGNLEITHDKIKYIEGPYSNDLKLLDPHRGCIEKLFMELIRIIEAIELKNY